MNEFFLLTNFIDSLQSKIEKDENNLGKKFGRPRKPLTLKTSKTKQQYHKAIKLIENKISDELPFGYSARSFITKQNGYIYPNPMIGVFLGEKSYLSNAEMYILISFSQDTLKIKFICGFEKLAIKLGITNDSFKDLIKKSLPDFIKINTLKEANGFKFDKDDISFLQKEIKVNQKTDIRSDLFYLLAILSNIKYSIYYVINEKFNLGLSEFDLTPNENENFGFDEYLLRKSRVGHSKYRELIFKKWKKQCCITGCTLEPILIASHIKPWSKCTAKEKVDPNNGLLLSPNYDAFFDRNLISFDHNGKIMISKNISLNNIQKAGIIKTTKIKLNEHQLKYMEYHRKRFIELESLNQKSDIGVLF